LTLTFDEPWRALIEHWDSMPRYGDGERRSISQLVTKLLNVLQQRHRNDVTFPGHYRRADKKRRGGGYEAQSKDLNGRVSAPSSSTPWTLIKWRKAFSIPPAR
jgi:hypothetical protein